MSFLQRYRRGEAVCYSSPVENVSSFSFLFFFSEYGLWLTVDFRHIRLLHPTESTTDRCVELAHLAGRTPAFQRLWPLYEAHIKTQIKAEENESYLKLWAIATPRKQEAGRVKKEKKLKDKKPVLVVVNLI